VDQLIAERIPRGCVGEYPPCSPPQCTMVRHAADQLPYRSFALSAPRLPVEILAGPMSSPSATSLRTSTSSWRKMVTPFRFRSARCAFPFHGVERRLLPSVSTLEEQTRPTPLALFRSYIRCRDFPPSACFTVASVPPRLRAPSRGEPSILSSASSRGPKCRALGSGL